MGQFVDWCPTGFKVGINYQPPTLSQEVTLPRFSVQSVCFPTPLPSLRHGLDLTTSSTSCTPSVHSFTGTSERVWKKENFPKLVKILPPSKRTTKKSASTQPKVKAKAKM